VTGWMTQELPLPVLARDFLSPDEVDFLKLI
jgi:hypothetical protein